MSRMQKELQYPNIRVHLNGLLKRSIRHIFSFIAMLQWWLRNWRKNTLM